jgi:two-component system NtrC family sensor kinase
VSNLPRKQNVITLSVLLLLTFFSLILVAGLARWEPWEVALLGFITLLLCAGFLLAIAHVAGILPRFKLWKGRRGSTTEETSPWEKSEEFQRELQQTRERLLDLTQEIRRKSDQLTMERDRAEFLRQSFGELASSLDPRHVLTEILLRATQIAGASRGSILLVNENCQPVEVFSARTGGKSPISQRTRDILNQGLAGWVVQNQQGEIIYDTKEDPRWLNFPGDEEPARSAVAVPFQRRRRVLGVIVLTHILPFQFKETHLQLLEELAQQAAICLENADLYTISKEERRKLAAILSGTTDVIIVVDEFGRILLLNRAAETAFQVQARNVLGKNLAKTIQHKDMVQLLSQGLESGQVTSGEITSADGRVLYGSISPIPGVGWVAILPDITYLKELDRMKSEFVSTVSHDLRSPLTTVRGFVDLVALLGPITEDQHEALEKISRAVTRMNELIEDLLDLGKVEAGIDMPMAACQVEELVVEAVESLLPRAELKRLQLTVERVASLPPIQGNETRLKQVVSNLIDNAIKYTPEGGRIKVHLSQRDGQIIVSVIDNGYGIAPKDQEQLFQKFYRVQTPETKEISGTGLGLAIVRSIIERHGGHVWVESEPEQGSIFSFSLPIPGKQELS